jgi:hypothetical protein
MKKLILPIALLFLLVACGSGMSELPPTPKPPGASSVGKAIAGMAGAMPTWAAPPLNIAVTPDKPYYGDGVIISVSNFDFIYSNAYYFNSRARVWEKFQLDGERAEDWVKGQGIGSTDISEVKFAEGENYVVVYACNKTNSKWDCNGGKWMLAKFDVQGSATGEIPELANVNDFVINQRIIPFEVTSTTAEADNFGDINVIRYDARYKDNKQLVVLVHVFDFNTRAELDTTLNDMFKEIIKNGWKTHEGNNLALFLDPSDHRIAVWSSGKEIIYVETFQAAFAAKEVIDAYLEKYPSDLPQIR